jgi:hypothetical protein
LKRKTKMKIRNYSKYLIHLTILLMLLLASGCSKKKSAIPFWMMALTGTSESGPETTSTDDSGKVDSNGEVLPATTNAVSSDKSTQETTPPKQEVATSGPAKITGSLKVYKGDAVASDFNGSDYEKITVQLVSPDGTVVATTKLDENGNYQFDLENLQNDNYRVLVNSGLGVNYTHEDFNFTHDPTATGGVTVVDVGEMKAERLYYSEGAATISGTVKTNGFSGDVTIEAKNLSGVTVELKDSNGTVLQTTTTDANGNYSFNYTKENPLANGNYTVNIKGSAVTESGRPYEDISSTVRFTFEGNDQAVATAVNAGETSLAWQAATTSPAEFKFKVANAAQMSDDYTAYTVTIKDNAGNVITTVNPDANGIATLTSASLSNGVYTVEVTKPNSYTSTSSVNFIANSTGTSTKVIDWSTDPTKTFNVVPQATRVSSGVTDGTRSPVPGAVINFKPNGTQSPVKLAYLLSSEDSRLKNLATLWIGEACRNMAVNDWNGTAADSLRCNCGGSGTACKYDTYQNKIFEVNGETVFFDAVAGKWDYYVTAPGYENSTVQAITLNGGSVNVPATTLVAATKRTEIQGQTVVLDTLVNGTKNSYGVAIPGYNDKAYGIPGLFVVMLGNTSSDGASNVAHIAITDANGAYKFDGNSKVITLPASLTTDEQRVGYAIQSYASAKTLSDASNNVLGNNPGTDVSVYGDGSKYLFKQSSYAIVVYDKLGHMSTSSTAASNGEVANNGALTVVNKIMHLPRRKITGNIADAITTGSLAGATVSLGRDTNPSPDIIDFVADIRKDKDTISTGSRLTNSSDELVPAATTSASGDFSISNIDPGEYVLKVSKDGYGDQFISVTVGISGDVVINTQLVANTGRGNLAGKVMLPGGHQFTGTYALELVHPTAGTRPTTGIQPASLTSGSSAFSNAPNYSVFSINAGQWKIKFAAAGYKSVEGIVNIQKGETTNFDIITMIPDSHGPANITGSALSAMTNSGISGLTIRIRPGVNVNSGAFATDINGNEIAAVTTGDGGSYAIPNVPPGNYTLEASCPSGNCGGSDFATTFITVISAGVDTPSGQNILVSPKLGADEMRIVLSWGDNPKDLDSHLEYGSARPEQAVWNDKSKLGGDLTLDIDVTWGNGPETVTMKGSTWAQARRGYSVYNWTKGKRDSSVPAISNSGAIIRIYKKQGLVRTYVAGAGQTSLWWHAFCVDGSMNITEIGQAGCSESSFFDSPSK